MPKLTLFFKGLALSVRHIQDEDEIILGREPDCDIQIDSLAVAPHHASIRRNGTHYRIFALDEKIPLAVNGETVSERELAHGDLIQVGKHTLEFAEDDVTLQHPAAPSPPSPQEPGGPPQKPKPQAKAAETGGNAQEARPEHSKAYLQILSGPHIGRILPLNQAMIRLGKSGGNCAMISCGEGTHFLSHLEGEMTLLNGKPIGERRERLANGDVIRMGQTEMEFFDRR